MPKGKSCFKSPNANGREFGELKTFENLSNQGKSILGKFKSDYEKKYKEQEQMEQQIYNYKKSKPPVEYNKWKYNNSNGNYFEKFIADKIHSFEVPIKEKHPDKKPFKRPSDYGDYFSKIDLSIEFDKFKS